MRRVLTSSAARPGRIRHHCTAATSHPNGQNSTAPHIINNAIHPRQFSSLPTPMEEQRSIAPIDFTTSSVVTGEESQILEVKLKEGEMLRAESGAMLYMTEGVQMETSMGNNLTNQQSGMQTALTRLMTGQNLMISDFTYTPTPGSNTTFGTVGLGTDFPAKILKFTLGDYPNSQLICQKGAYLAGSHTVLMEMAYTKNFTSGFFGGEGFVLQSLRAESNSDDETVFLKAYGTSVKRDLKEGETLRVSSGSLVAMTSDVDFDVTTLSGFKNVLFGGEGLFVTTLTGPGKVWLQGMPVDRMVSEIARRVPSGGGIGLGIPIMGGGGGGGEGDAVAAREESAAAGDSSEAADSGVPVSDAAVDADRNSTIASSGLMDSSDPESAESLFGDAAYGGSTPKDDAVGSSSHEDVFSEPQMNIPEFEEPTITETQFDEPTMSEPQFEDDGTTFTNESSSSAGSEELSSSPDEGPSLISQLWDFFTSDDE
ncbi:hypothetical protein ACHAXN_012269 [Cyclotella atomus]